MKKSNSFKQTNFLILLVIVYTVLLSPIISAEKINQPVNLIQTCNNCTYCNISIILYPNSTMMLNNVNMTQNGTAYNYTIDSSYITEVGTYSWFYNCGNDYEIEVNKLTFDITRTGKILTLQETIIQIVVLVIAIIVFGILLFFGLTIPMSSKRNEDGGIISINELKYVKLFVIFLAYLLLMFIVFTLEEISRNYLYLNTLGQVLKSTFYVMTYTVYALFVGMILLTIYWVVNDKKIFEMIERGINPR